ncbi:hypothetical protein [Bradyrhizobium sp. BR 10261]|uniref:hypothetical protein n=1 Tax=Bradyrhizobium sp. BR 10261 TaxID=2749992 RepID=UPI001C64915E|nr:hypothetical protein [Bradyrhizobium sp. BR 10261]MBW7967564.1 hypothetical protein [Bradyrhizobium sp. BR 10261]
MVDLGDTIEALMRAVAFLAVCGGCFLAGILLQYFGGYAGAPVWSVGIGVICGLIAARLVGRLV